MRTSQSLLTGVSPGGDPPDPRDAIRSGRQADRRGWHGSAGPARGATPGARAAPLLQIALDLGGRARVCRPRILAELAPGPALPQQVPALVEGFFCGFQPGVLLVGGQLTCGELAAQLVLGLDELIDVPEDLLVVHVPTVWGPPQSPQGALRPRASPGR